jgi:hypothetical protein
MKREATIANANNAPDLKNTLVGNLDACGPTCINGWLHDTANPNRALRIEIRVDGKVVARTTADLFRSDLLEQGIGNGLSGFQVAMPEILFDGSEHMVEARETSSGFLLPGSPVKTAPFAVTGSHAYADFVDSAWYVSFYSDVAEAETDAAAHFRLHGASEGRNPNRFFKTAWYLDTYLQRRPSDIDALQHFLSEGASLGFKPHPLIDLQHIRQTLGFDSNLDAFADILRRDSEIDHTCAWFSRTQYIQDNPDLVGIGDLEDHFLTHGQREARPPSSAFRVLSRSEFARIGAQHSEVVDEYEWEHNKYLVVRSRVSDAIVSQIVEQGEFDPTVYAAGIRCLPRLPYFISDNLRHRDLFDHKALLSEFDNAPEVLVIVGRIGIGGGEKYAATLTDTLARELGLRCSVVTTESSAADNLSACALPLLRGFRSARVVSLFDHLAANSWKRETILALLMLALKPRLVFVINSDLGLRAMEKHGAAMRNVSQIYVALFSQSPFAIGAPYSAVYLKQIIRNVKVLSDNKAALETFQQAVPPSAAGKFVCIPQRVDLPSRAEFMQRVEARVTRRRNGGRTRCLWISRWEAFKATDVLIELADRNERVIVDAFGPGQSVDPTPRPDNLRDRGVLWNLKDIELADYDAFIFTSRFEGMPNTVLEMVAQGIPVIASDVGGLRETFGGDTIRFVGMAGDVPQVAAGFTAALDELLGLSTDDMRQHLIRCFDAVAARHSGTAFKDKVRALVEQGTYAKEPK